MKTYTLRHTDLSVSRIGYGCATLTGWDRNPTTAEEVSKVARAIHAACESGITLFDHADLYSFGKSEAVFGQVLKESPGLRNRIALQSKCGERFREGAKLGDPVGADLSREHIVRAVEGSLTRLGTDRLDILLLHVADALMEPDEVAEAFDDLHRTGKVRYFGASNHHASQIQLLRKHLRHPLVVNQIPLSLAHTALLADGMENTLQNAKWIFRDRHAAVAGSGTVDYCRLNEIQIQASSPLRGVLNPPEDSRPERKQAAQRLTELAREKDVTPAAIALAWLLRHPAHIVPIIGSTNPEHIRESCAADRLTLTREEWYALFAAAAVL